MMDREKVQAHLGRWIELWKEFQALSEEEQTAVVIIIGLLPEQTIPDLFAREFLSTPPVKRGRGRPKGSKNKAAEAPIAGSAT